MIKMQNKLLILALIWLFFLAACARLPVKDPLGSMRRANGPKEIIDFLSINNFKDTLLATIDHLKKSSKDHLRLGPDQVDKEKYIEGLQQLLSQLNEKNEFNEDLYNYIRNNFYFYEVYGSKKWGDVLVTSYFDPLIKGSRKKSEKFTHPLYSRPKDLVVVRVDKFFEEFPKLKNGINGEPNEQKSDIALLRGRLITENTKYGFPEILPYFSRADIDKEMLLKNQKLEIVWVDSVDAFFLQIQGSGIVELENGDRIRVGYDAQNGHPYEPIGKFLFDKIPKEEMSMQSIRRYLYSLPPDSRQDLLNLNPSYVFFKKLDSKSITYSGMEVKPGRTIATDKKLFDKGLLGYLEIERPVFKDKLQNVPESWEPNHRFVIDMDTGGAIRGPGRVDLYWGEGPDAGKIAGVMNRRGRLFYLAPKTSIIESSLKQ